MIRFIRERLLRFVEWLSAPILPEWDEPKPLANFDGGVSLTFPPRDGRHRIVVTRVVDGDTIRFCWLVDGGSARLFGIDAPEMHGERAQAGIDAAKFLQTLTSGMRSNLLAQSHGPDKYGRVLLTLYTDEGKSINELLIEKGHAKPYDGKGPRP